ncbi:hypothetical protein LEP1GSC192_2530 [Leptospira sp. B5-022]|nr:hypothetical protein LEP1GSC192_2530 [Leptospira sp. B5-022]
MDEVFWFLLPIGIYRISRYKYFYFIRQSKAKYRNFFFPKLSQSRFKTPLFFFFREKGPSYRGGFSSSPNS